MALSLTLGACDSYLDINESPNSPAVGNLTPDLIFPGAEMAFANSYSDYFRITGGYFAQHYSQFFGTSNYMDYSQFMQSAVRSSSTYSNLATRTLQNMSTVISLAEASESLWHRARSYGDTCSRVSGYGGLLRRDSLQRIARHQQHHPEI